MVPPPATPHDDLDSRLNRLLMKFLLENNIDGDVHHPQAAIYREGEWATYLYPDMMFVSRELRQQMGKRRTSADVVFEYSSPSTSTYDATTKADTYLALEVSELWLIDPVSKTIEVRHATRDNESLVWKVFRYSAGERATSRVLLGWEVSVDNIFENLE